MVNVKKQVGRKVAKATFRHSVNGLIAKSKRQPLRSTTLLSVGGLVGATAGFLAGRRKPAQTS